MVAPHSTLPDDPDLAAAKAEARTAARAAQWAAVPDAGDRLAAHLAGLWPARSASVAAFWPMTHEIDTVPLLHAWHALGHAVLLPRTPPLGQPLTFHRWRPGAALVTERFGTQAPAGLADEPAELPDAFLVPLLAFDEDGRRLGYGGGYYDRTLAALPGRPVLGCAYAAQRIARVPAGPRDVVLPGIATEQGLHWFD